MDMSGRTAKVSVASAGVVLAGLLMTSVSAQAADVMAASRHGYCQGCDVLFGSVAAGAGFGEQQSQRAGVAF